MKSNIFSIFLVLLLCTLVTGCGLFGKKPEKTAPELLVEGREAFENEKYRRALEAFQRLRDWYPFSQHATEATLRIADAHYALKEYAEAAVVYAEFERLHPNNPETPRAVFQLGMCHFERMDTVDRDQTPAKNALYIFLRLQEDYAGTPYAAQAAEKIQLCRESLAGAELYVASYYFRTKAFVAAKGRVETLLAAYPETPQAEEARFLLKKITKALEKQASP
ncbi:outer membrane protein assembly factor BamD [Desulfobotulus sp.]|jgi:outer membrane protein assembly factor BamD|uniref:outer membrane protein assembly factor BamD n=1 Tax=Desulfobotulus sp. TaxID=1940337 RepID=UPI002A371E24|nr:outer membrane protein assembly factor BamD [Desulfobotulus sp.]MDY0163150.1 outer membrane protein assembly factor BamD [Desulfobotulus sp.]